MGDFRGAAVLVSGLVSDFRGAVLVSGGFGGRF